MRQSVVAFADALGTKASTCSELTSKTFLGQLQTATDLVCQRLNGIGRLYDIQVRWFSDSIAMSVNFDDSSQLAELLENLAFVQAGYALNGIFLRGAVTTGLHYHSEFIDYGPALSEAVTLEQSTAGDTTRIVLSPHLQHDLRAFGPPRLSIPVLADLGDDAYFLDFLGALDPASRPVLRDQIEASYTAAKALGNARVIQKLAWLISYYNWRTKPPKRLRYGLSRDFSELFKI
jgi:hypothetical protein